jgi:tetratricopeptide (TPR) repeat protein
MQTIRIFLASSSELKAEREVFEQNLNRQNKRWKNKGFLFELVHWEDYDDAVHAAGKQSDYNCSLEYCDILVVLYWTKMGRYTREEFETGWAQFQQTGRPIIFVYEKTAPFRPGKKEDVGSLFAFKDRLGEIKHFPTQVEEADALLLHFNTQLSDRYDGVDKRPPISALSPSPQQLTSYAPINPATECIGREAELQHLAEIIARAQRVVVVNGLGGIGKTTVAKAWFQSAKDRYDHWAWIEAAGNDAQPGAIGIVETIAWHPALAENLGLAFGEKEEPQARFMAVMNALRKLEGNNLLVIDNAGPEMEQPAIREQLPIPPHWQVLLTSRRRLNGYEAAPLDRLKPEHAAALFRQHYTGACTDAELEALLQELDYHTLSLELIAKTLQEHLGSLSLLEMTEKLRRRQLADHELQRRIAINHSKEETEVYAHLLVTFQCAGLDEAERLLLARMAALPPAGAYAATDMEEWFRIDPDDRKTLHETLSRLERKGWLSRSPTQRFSLHRMIQQAVMYQLKPGMAELDALVETFTQKLDFDVSTNYTLLFIWIPYAEQVLAILPEAERGQENVSRLMNSLGSVVEETGQYERARDLLEAALDSDLKNFGAEHPNVAVSQSNLANVYSDLGQYERARDLLEAALESAMKNFGAEHPTVAVSQSNLANVYSDLGQYERARDLLEAALDSDLKNFGAEHPRVAVRQSNLANVYRNLGQYERARDLLEAALESAMKNFGAEHPTVAVSQSNLALVYQALGQYERARDLLEAALESDLKNFGAEHPNVAVSESNLANVYSDLGQYERARDLLEAALDSAMKTFGAEHPTVANRLNNLAHVYKGMDDTARARELFERALEIFRQSLGEEHPNVGAVRESLAALRDGA